MAKAIKSSLALATGAALLLALAAPLGVDRTLAQKTAARNTYQQQQVSSSNNDDSGNNPVSVYGGYQSSSSSSSSSSGRKTALAPVSANRRVSQSSQSSSYNRQQQVQQPVAQQSYSRQQVVEQSSYSSDQQQAEADAEPPSYGAVAGVPGRDFPNYARVPKTSFSCEGLPFSEYGYYADEETGCQAYHVCYGGRKDSFLCGPGTVFNQRILHCDYWYSVDCAKSSQYYSSSNAYMGSSQPEPGPAQASSSPSSTNYKRTQQSSSSGQSNYARPANVPQQPTRQAAASNSFSRNTQQVQEEIY